jgi:hypothetical protein
VPVVPLRSVMTEHHGLRDWTEVITHSCEGWKSEIKASAGLISPWLTDSYHFFFLRWVGTVQGFELRASHLL